MEKIDIVVTIDPEEIKQRIEAAAQQIIKDNIEKTVRMHWESWSNRFEFRNQIKDAINVRLQAQVEEILQDYEGIKARVTKQIHNSLAARVTNVTKRTEGV